MGSSPRSYFFTSETGRIGVHSAPKYGTKPIRNMTLHFQDRRKAASRRHDGSCVLTEVLSGMISVAAQTLLACENIRFSSLFAAVDVSRETSPGAKSEDKRMFSQAKTLSGIVWT